MEALGGAARNLPIDTGGQASSDDQLKDRYCGWEDSCAALPFIGM